MKTKTIIAVAVIEALFGGTLTLAHAQQPQIPTLQVCNETQAKGKAKIQIASRADATHSGSFVITVDRRTEVQPQGWISGRQSGDQGSQHV